MVTFACVLGQAAGTAAAICLKDSTAPAKIDVKALQKTLLEQDCVIDD